jgi:hypothetical protein
VLQTILFTLGMKARNPREGVAGFRRLSQVFVALKTNRNPDLSFGSISVRQCFADAGYRSDDSQNAAAAANGHALA